MTEPDCVWDAVFEKEFEKEPVTVDQGVSVEETDDDAVYVCAFVLVAVNDEAVRLPVFVCDEEVVVDGVAVHVSDRDREALRVWLELEVYDSEKDEEYDSDNV